MAKLTMTKKVEAPIDIVFDIFSDIEKATERISGIEKIEMLTDGPVGKGTRFRETRIMFKRETTEELEFTAFEPGKHYTIGCESCGCTYETTFRFERDGSGTKVEMNMSARPVTFFARIMSPLAVLMMGSMKKAMDKDMEELKAAAEKTS